MLNRMVDLNKIPDEVMWVLTVSGCVPVGRSTFEKCQKIIDKYPKYFPWEHAYKSIPKEVHDAYMAEVNPDWDKPIISNDNKCGAGVKSEIGKVYYKSDVVLTQKMFEDMIFEHEKMEQERIEERKKQKALWDKHYKIYGLEYKG